MKKKTCSACYKFGDRSHHRSLQVVPPLVLQELHVRQHVLQIRRRPPRLQPEVGRVVLVVLLHHPDQLAAVELGSPQLLDAERPGEVPVRQEIDRTESLSVRVQSKIQLLLLFGTKVSQPFLLMLG